MAFLVAPRYDEPFYKGHSLTYWALRHHRGDTNSASRQAATALGQIGTNAIPHVVRWMQYQETFSTREGFADVNYPIRALP